VLLSSPTSLWVSQERQCKCRVKRCVACGCTPGTRLLGTRTPSRKMHSVLCCIKAVYINIWAPMMHFWLLKKKKAERHLSRQLRARSSWQFRKLPVKKSEKKKKKNVCTQHHPPPPLSAFPTHSELHGEKKTVKKKHACQILDCERLKKNQFDQKVNTAEK
jgi:hypothetical protein